MTGYDVTIESLPTCGFLDLRGGEAVREACSEFLGISLPTAANTLVSGADDRLAPGDTVVALIDDSAIEDTVAMFDSGNS